MNAYIVYVNGIAQGEPVAAEDHKQAVIIAEAKYEVGLITVYQAVME